MTETEQDRPFLPDWVSPPGDTIADLLEERGWSQAELARQLDYSPEYVSKLIKAKVPVTEETALRLERVLGSTARFWLALEAQYRADCARLGIPS
jgi:HTH-type transcriptional regulator/antitoxin HigA